MFGWHYFSLCPTNVRTIDDTAKNQSLLIKLCVINQVASSIDQVRESVSDRRFLVLRSSDPLLFAFFGNAGAIADVIKSAEKHNPTVDSERDSTVR